MFEGFGKKISEGAVYEGNWKDGLPNGHGKCIFADKSTYDGNWKDG